MATVPDHNAPEVRESEVKVFRQKYYIVDDEEDTSYRMDYHYPLHEARVEVMADDDGVFLEAKEGNVTESLSIPTSDLAVSVAKYILGAYGAESVNSVAEDSEIGTIKFLDPAVQNCIAHELWRLSNHITSPHGFVVAQGAPELHGHLDKLVELLGIKPAPHSGHPNAYKPDYNKGLKK